MEEKKDDEMGGGEREKVLAEARETVRSVIFGGQDIALAMACITERVDSKISSKKIKKTKYFRQEPVKCSIATLRDFKENFLDQGEIPDDECLAIVLSAFRTLKMLEDGLHVFLGIHWGRNESTKKAIRGYTFDQFVKIGQELGQKCDLIENVWKQLGCVMDGYILLSMISLFAKAGDSIRKIKGFYHEFEEKADAMCNSKYCAVLLNHELWGEAETFFRKKLLKEWQRQPTAGLNWKYKSNRSLFFAVHGACCGLLKLRWQNKSDAYAFFCEMQECGLFYNNKLCKGKGEFRLDFHKFNYSRTRLTKGSWGNTVCQFIFRKAVKDSLKYGRRSAKVTLVTGQARDQAGEQDANHLIKEFPKFLEKRVPGIKCNVARDGGKFSFDCENLKLLDKKLSEEWE